MQTQAKNFHIRGLPGRLMLLLKQRAEAGRTSVNAVVIQLIERGLGAAPQLTRMHRVYDDLDALAGTWSAEDIAAFDENVQPCATAQTGRHHWYQPCCVGRAFGGF